MKLKPEDIGKKMDALGLWDLLRRFNFAIKPHGTVFPYFCTVIKGDDNPVKNRFLMLEGWQTMHDFVRIMVDRNFGYYLTPAEMPHFELVLLSTGEAKIFRHNPGYIPNEVRDVAQRKFVSKILWEAYGIMMRIESDRSLPMKYASEKAVFARVEGEKGEWTDSPLTIPDPPPYTENVSVPMVDMKAVKDLPLVADFAMELDFRICQNIVTKEPRPRYVYELAGFDAKIGEQIIGARTSVAQDVGMKGMWESMPCQLVKEILRIGKVPSEIRVCSGRMFRLLRPLCIDIPFKLSLHDSLPAFRGKV